MYRVERQLQVMQDGELLHIVRCLECMNIYALLLVGRDKPLYFEFDTWRVDDDCLRLFKNKEAIAVFAMRNVVGLINLHMEAHLDLKDTFAKIDPTAPFNLKK